MERRSALVTIATCGLVAGTLDALAAVVTFVASTGRNPVRIAYYIASAVFGQVAFSGNALMAVMGILFHYLIATIWSAIYYLAYRYIAPISRNRVVNGLVYGIVVWAGMNLVVVPNSRVPSFAIRFPDAIYAAAILMVCVGLPIAFLVDRAYRK